MGIAGSVLVLVIAWWLAFFAMLPIGVRSQAETGEIAAGTDPGAPAAARLGRKAMWAALIAMIVWAGLFAVINYRLVTLDDLPFMPAKWQF